ncbi:hypothetical protein BH24GEM1_BH24GEM1_27850 [soil metagenome]
MANRSAIWLGVLASGALALGTGCNEAKDTGAVTSRSGGETSRAPAAETLKKRNLALVRAVNVIPDGDPVTIWAGDSAAFTGVGYSEATPYREITDNMFRFQIRAGGVDGKSLAENRESLDDGGHYTIVALPSAEEGRRTLRVLDDDQKPVPSDKARVRFVNGVPGDSNVDLFVRGRDEPLFDDVKFATEAGWDEFDPIAGTLVVRPDDRNTSLATLPNVKLEGGKSYTFVLAGRPGRKYELVKIEDEVAVK